MKIILNQDQEKIRLEAINWFYNSSSQVFEIDGKAGTGKTVLIAAILKSLHLRENQYYPMAYTGQASIVMRTRGFPNAKSIHATLYEIYDDEYEESISKAYGVPGRRKKFRLRKYIDKAVRLFFIDEGYMVPANMVKDILSFGIKVIVCGDSHQLPPVEGQPAFLTGYGIHHLTQLMRQAENSAIVYIADRASRGLPIHCGTYGGEVLVISDDDFIDEMIGFADCICCGTNRTRTIMNSYVRALAGFNTTLPMMGERVICRKNNWEIQQDGIALANGLTGTVIDQIQVGDFDGSSFVFDFKPDLANTIFFDVEANFDYFIAPPEVKNEMKSMYRSNKYKYETGEFFDFAYALTTHLCQGSEYQNGIYIEEFLHAQTQAQLNYTGITRFKNKLVYVKKKKRTFEVPNLKN